MYITCANTLFYIFLKYIDKNYLKINTINLQFLKYGFIIDEFYFGSEIARKMNSCSLKICSHFHLIFDIVEVK